MLIVNIRLIQIGGCVVSRFSKGNADVSFTYSIISHMMPKMFLAIEVCHITCNFGPPCMDELYIDVFNLFVGYKYLSQKCGLVHLQ